MKTKFYFPLLLFPFVIYSQSGNELLKKVQEKFKSVDNFSALFNQTIYDENGKASVKMNGTFSYKRKNKFIVEMKNSAIVSNSETIWNYDKKLKRVIVSNFSDDPTSFSFERYIFDYPSLCRVKNTAAQNSEEQILELIPKNDNLDFKSVKIWLNKNYMITKMEIVDLGDVKYSFQLSDIKENQEISDSKFTFYPPKGIEIIDLR
ncbi:MAG: outer membrane lipoprotein chaperone LolA [Ignavibacteriales bacterium]|nr:outer membrane lipoprotein chaperone LolA [Ignavibacteriales bacterium]